MDGYIPPFANPINHVQELLNSQAFELYNDTDARESNRCMTALAPNPDSPFVWYWVDAGWTKEGWRAFSMEKPFEKLNFFGQILATELLKARLLRSMYGDDAPWQMDGSADEDCGSPNCPVHGPLHRNEN